MFPRQPRGMGKSIRFALEIQRPPETAHQGSLFSAHGAPDPSAAYCASVPGDLRQSLRRAGVPPRHGPACLKFLLEDRPIDPQAVAWLGDPANARRAQNTRPSARNRMIPTFGR